MFSAHNTNASRTARTLVILFFVLIVTAVTFVLSVSAPPRYVTSLSISVNRTAGQPTSDYQYDGYYALQASDLFSQTLLSWFLTPSVLLAFYERAGIDPQIGSLNDLTSRFRARKFAAQNLVVQFTENDRQSAQKLAEAISAVVQEQGSTLDTSTDNKATFAIVPAKAVIVETRQNALLNTLAACVGSLLLGFAFLASWRYVR